MKKFILIILYISFLSCTNTHYNNFDNGTNQKSKSVIKTKDDGTSIIARNKTLSFDNGTNNHTQEIIKSLDSKKNLDNGSNNSKKNISNKNTLAKNNSKSSATTSKPNTKSKKTNKQVETSLLKKNDSKNGTYPKQKSQSAKKAISKKEVQKQKEIFYYPVSHITLDTDKDFKKTQNLKFKLQGEDSIFPAGKGIVIFSGDKGGIGKTLFVYHNNGYISIYYNLKKLNVNKGDYIKTLDSKIATASDSFNFELRKQTDDGIVKLNPKDYLQKRHN